MPIYPRARGSVCATGWITVRLPQSLVPRPLCLHSFEGLSPTGGNLSIRAGWLADISTLFVVTASRPATSSEEATVLLCSRGGGLGIPRTPLERGIALSVLSAIVGVRKNCKRPWPITVFISFLVRRRGAKTDPFTGVSKLLPQLNTVSQDYRSSRDVLSKPRPESLRSPPAG